MPSIVISPVAFNITEPASVVGTELDVVIFLTVIFPGDDGLPVEVKLVFPALAGRLGGLFKSAGFKPARKITEGELAKSRISGSGSETENIVSGPVIVIFPPVILPVVSIFSATPL